VNGSEPIEAEGIVFIVDFTTRQGRVTERFETYEEALRRVEGFPADALLGPAYIFQQLADGSERLVREDGKPLQFHRLLVEDSRAAPEEPLPLAEGESGLVGPEGKLRIVQPQPQPFEDDDDPIPLV
jgi:hypothetical protein